MATAKTSHKVLKDKNGKRFGRPTRKKVIKERLTPEEYEFCTLLAQRVPVNEATRQVGWKDESYGYHVMKRAHVSRYLEKLKIRVEAKEIEATAEQIAKGATVTRSELIAHIWGLSKLDPSKTNGNITGQVKAAETLGKMLGMMVERTADVTKEFEGRSDEELAFFAQNGYWPENVDSEQSGTGGA